MPRIRRSRKTGEVIPQGPMRGVPRDRPYESTVGMKVGYVCQVCSCKYVALVQHIRRKHNMSANEYRRKFKIPPSLNINLTPKKLLGRKVELYEPSAIDPSRTKFELAVKYAESGIHPEVAARAAGITPQTLKNWELKGAKLIEDLASGAITEDELNDNDRAYLAFNREITDAHAKFASLVLQRRSAQAKRGTIQTTTETYAYVEKRTGEGHNERVERVKVPVGEKVVTKEDPASVDNWLQSNFPKVFGRVPKQIELTGKDGAPVELGGAVAGVDLEGFLGELMKEKPEVQEAAMKAYDSLMADMANIREERKRNEQKVIGKSEVED